MRHSKACRQFVQPNFDLSEVLKQYAGEHRIPNCRCPCLIQPHFFIHEEFVPAPAPLFFLLPLVILSLVTPFPNERGSLLFFVAKREHDFRFADKFAGNGSDAFSFADRAFCADDLDFESELVTRLHLLFKAAVVDASEESKAAAVFFLFQHRDGADLRQCLDD